jgi:chorismate mutase
MEPTLDFIAARLEGLEETIISKLIDRAQFCVNDVVYAPGMSGFTSETRRSLFDVRMWYQEEMDAKFGRFCVPEERPFSTGLPLAMRIVHLQESFLGIKDFTDITLAPAIRSSYLSLVTAICPAGDDGQYGSSTEHDIYALQSIGRRIHFGALYVGESKYRQDPGGFARLIARNDHRGLVEMLTRKSVEDAIIERVAEKVAALQANVNTRVRHRIDPETILKYYRDTIIPLTKEGEIMYITRRCNQEKQKSL